MGKSKRRADYGERWGRNSYPSCAHLSVNETFHCVTQSDAHYFSRVTCMLHAEGPKWLQPWQLLTRNHEGCCSDVFQVTLT